MLDLQQGMLEQISPMLEQGRRSIDSFFNILEDHRQPHIDLMLSYSGLWEILNDYLNNRVKSLDSSIDFSFYKTLVENKVKQSIENYKKTQSQQDIDQNQSK